MELSVLASFTLLPLFSRLLCKESPAGHHHRGTLCNIPAVTPFLPLPAHPGSSSHP